MIVALTADIGVLQGAAFDGVIEEGAVEPALQDGFDRSDRPGADCQSALARRIEAVRVVAPGQGQNAETGSEALFRMGTIGHDPLAKSGDRGAELHSLGQHPCGGPVGMTPMCRGHVVGWPRPLQL